MWSNTDIDLANMILSSLFTSTKERDQNDFFCFLKPILYLVIICLLYFVTLSIQFATFVLFGLYQVIKVTVGCNLCHAIVKIIFIYIKLKNRAKVLIKSLIKENYEKNYTIFRVY